MFCRGRTPVLEKKVVIVDWRAWLDLLHETRCGFEFDLFGHVVRDLPGLVFGQLIARMHATIMTATTWSAQLLGFVFLFVSG